jgi:hypothetical protein
MKTSRAFALAAVALAIGFFAARWCPAQSSNQPPTKEPTSYDFGALQQFESLVAYLQDAKQTNTLQRFNDYTTASLASQHYTDLGMTVAVLQRMRDGRTDQAYELLESQLNSDIIVFASSYRRLPPSLRDQTSLELLGRARDYRAQYRPERHYQIIDDGVANAFKILDEKTTK